MRRVSSLSNLAGIAIDRETDSKYDNIKKVAEQLDDISALTVPDPDDNTKLIVDPNIEIVAGLKDEIEGLNTTVDVVSNLSVTAEQLGYTEPASANLNSTTGEITIGVPAGIPGVNGLDGMTPVPEFTYNSGTGILSVDVTYEPATIDQNDLGEW